MQSVLESLQHEINAYLRSIYADVPLSRSFEDIAEALIEVMRLQGVIDVPLQYQNHWDQRDVVMITYADTFLHDDEKPLAALLSFMEDHTDGEINSIHILPFFPYSSDDGFAVMDFSTVNPAHGDWKDICHIAGHYRLMADLVINHCSSRSQWFENFIKQVDPGKDYFFTASPEEDLSRVVRPRTNPLLQEVETADGTKHVWCTFSHDQVDFDFRNPEVLIQFASIIRLYLDMGIRIFRLDAIAFLWKIPGTNCLNLQQTHDVVRLLRLLVEYAQHDAVIITETNIPNRENLTYFGNNNEAHWIYNFSLPPLLVYTLLTGDCHYLKQWIMAMPPAQNGTTYFNFIASHDGIGLRPIEGMLSEDEEQHLIDTLQSFGGRVSWRALDNGDSKPYEVNIALYDALKGTVRGEDEWNVERFICAHTIMMGMEGVPAFYVHSLLATHNDYQRLENAGHNRAINRHQWDYAELEKALDDQGSHHSIVFAELKRLMAIRAEQRAFHPNATQFTLHLGEQVFAFWRQSLDRRQSIFCISNVSDEQQKILLSGVNFIITEDWFDLIGSTAINLESEYLVLEPYQTVWVSNIPSS